MFEATALREVSRSAGLRYGAAALAVTISSLAAELLQAYMHTEPYASSFLCAVMFAAWYGGVGAGLALLVWIYLLGVILLFGCEFNWARERGAQ